MESGEETSDFERIESLNEEEMQQLLKDFNGDLIMNGAPSIENHKPQHPSEPSELSFEKRKFGF